MAASRRELAGLVGRAQQGDREAFGALVAATAPLVLHSLALRGLQPAEADDCLQETFVRAYQGLAGFEERSDVRTWLLGIARNVALQRGRSERGLPEVQEHHASSDGDALTALVARERQAELRAALARLPERMRLALQLRFVERLSCEEIAQLLDTSLPAISPLIYRAKQALREQLEGQRRGSEG
ncbi:MAG: RNA polymerase sigma factor [Planctomycetota bacterium]